VGRHTYRGRVRDKHEYFAKMVSIAPVTLLSLKGHSCFENIYRGIISVTILIVLCRENHAKIYMYMYMSHFISYGLLRILIHSRQGWRCTKGPIIQYRCLGYVRISSYTSCPTESNLGWPTQLEKP
jgi:hypothetical protein